MLTNKEFSPCPSIIDIADKLSYPGLKFQDGSCLNLDSMWSNLYMMDVADKLSSWKTHAIGFIMLNRGRPTPNCRRVDKYCMLLITNSIFIFIFTTMLNFYIVHVHTAHVPNWFTSRILSHIHLLGEVRPWKSWAHHLRLGQAWPFVSAHVLYWDIWYVCGVHMIPLYKQKKKKKEVSELWILILIV